MSEPPRNPESRENGSLLDLLLGRVFGKRSDRANVVDRLREAEEEEKRLDAESKKKKQKQQEEDRQREEKYRRDKDDDRQRKMERQQKQEEEKKTNIKELAEALENQKMKNKKEEEQRQAEKEKRRVADELEQEERQKEQEERQKERERMRLAKLRVQAAISEEGNKLGKDYADGQQGKKAISNKNNDDMKAMFEQKMKTADQEIAVREQEIRRVEAEAMKNLQNLHQEAMNAARRRGQQNAMMVGNAIKKTYERGVQDGIACTMKKFEQAGSSENGIVIVHDGSDSSINIAGKLGVLFRRNSFFVPALLSQDEEMPPCKSRCRLKWLLLYYVHMGDQSTGYIREAIEKSSQYFSNPFFEDCSKFFILQCRDLPKKDDVDGALNRFKKTSAIVSAIPQYHHEIVEKTLNAKTSGSFFYIVNKLMEAATSSDRCIFKISDD